MDAHGAAWLAVGYVEYLPNTGVKLSVIVFGGLALLILGGGLFLAGRRHHQHQHQNHHTHPVVSIPARTGNQTPRVVDPDHLTRGPEA